MNAVSRSRDDNLGPHSSDRSRTVNWPLLDARGNWSQVPKGHVPKEDAVCRPFAMKSIPPSPIGWERAGVRVSPPATRRAIRQTVWTSLFALALTFSVTFPVLGQQKDDGADLIQSIDQWMRENLDDSILEVLDQIDQDKVREAFSRLQKRFQGSSIYELGDAQETAKKLLPILEQFEETEPYAAWLKAHLDYFDTANELRRQMTPPVPKPGIPIPKPSLQVQRSVWNKQLEKRPTPPLAKPYVTGLKQIFSEEKMPSELVWLAEVESSFNPKARSPAGAAGLFQLMPATARQYGLNISWWRDDRLEPDKNGRAAARHLRHLHGRFGDWPLALAAYNAGEARVENLLKKSTVRSFDAIAARLPAETQMYVPKMEATLRKREGRVLTDLKRPS